MEGGQKPCGRVSLAKTSRDNHSSALSAWFSCIPGRFILSSMTCAFFMVLSTLCVCRIVHSAFGLRMRIKGQPLPTIAI